MISLGEIAEIISIHPNSQLLSGDILLSTKGTIGPAKLVSSETTLEHSSRYCVIRLKSEQMTPEYLYRCICSDEFQNNLLLFFVGNTRKNTDILSNQLENIKRKRKETIEALHYVKGLAQEMHSSLKQSDITLFGELLNKGWLAKKKFTQ